MAWFVFPVVGKKPALEGDWRAHATNDYTTIQSWLAQGYGLALDCGRSDITVIDFDPGSDPASLNLPKTYTPATPRGRHAYYQGVAPTSAGRLGAHIDTRGVGGYVVIYDKRVIENCRLGRGPVQGIEVITALPEHVRGLLSITDKKAVARETGAGAYDVRRAKLMLAQREPCGCRDLDHPDYGNDGLYRAICAVLDLGDFSDDQIHAAMEDWCKRGRYPVDVDELEAMLANVRKSRQNDTGAWAAGDPTSRFRGFHPAFSAPYGVGSRDPQATDPVAAGARSAQASNVARPRRCGKSWDLRMVGTSALIQELLGRLDSLRAVLAD
jgi:hypothetical protein